MPLPDLDKKKAIFLGIILVSGTLISIFFFVWQTFLNHGTISIIGPAPFTVEIFGISIHECPDSPCQITQTSGKKTLILEKIGFKAIVLEADVPFRKTVNIEASFRIIPFLVNAEIYPEIEKPVEYKISYDQEKNKYKLYDDSDSYQRPILFFQNEIKEPQIISGKEAALIIETGSRNNSIYRIDTVGKKREKINLSTLYNIQTGFWSDDGQSLLFTIADSPSFWLLNSENEIYTLDLLIQPTAFAWTYQNNLLFATTQVTELINQAGVSKFEYVDVSEKVSSTGVTFGIYYPEENSYTKIESFPEVFLKPINMIPTANLHEIYFQTLSAESPENFKIILEKF